MFDDDVARIEDDPDHSIGEHREVIIGYSREGRLLVVSFVQRGETLRIISARRVDARERKRHEEENSCGDLRPHYDFDYEDVSKVLQSSEDVNVVLRSAIRAMRTAAPKPRVPKRRVS